MTGIRNLLCNNGFGYIWIAQHVKQEKTFLFKFVSSLKYQLVQEWFGTIRDSSKLSSYFHFKSEFKHEAYLNYVKIRKFRYALATLRSSSHNLEIERGGYNNTPKENRICELCNSAIETEYHFVLVCSSLRCIREKYIPQKIYYKYQ